MCAVSISTGAALAAPPGRHPASVHPSLGKRNGRKRTSMTARKAAPMYWKVRFGPTAAIRAAATPALPDGPLTASPRALRGRDARPAASGRGSPGSPAA